MRKFPVIRLVLAACVGIFISIHTPFAQSSTPYEIAVSVTDKNGVPITNLTSADFVVREDGALREVLEVRSDSASKQIALLVDNSQAAEPAIPQLRAAVSAFILGMNTGNQITIITFGGTPRILVDSTDDLNRLQQGVDRIFSSSGTASYLLDAIEQVSTGFTRRSAKRPVMIVLSTLGIDYSNSNERTALERLQDSGAAMHSVVLTRLSSNGTEPTSSFLLTPPSLTEVPENVFREQGLNQASYLNSNIERDRVISRGPAESGGRRNDLLSVTSLERALMEIAAQLKGQYILKYSRPPTLIPPNQVEIDIRQKGADASLDITLTRLSATK